MYVWVVLIERTFDTQCDGDQTLLFVLSDDKHCVKHICETDNHKIDFEDDFYVVTEYKCLNPKAPSNELVYERLHFNKEKVVGK